MCLDLDEFRRIFDVVTYESDFLIRKGFCRRGYGALLQLVTVSGEFSE